MIGNLLMASDSVNFRYNRAAGPVNVANNGSTTIVNPAVADDNSPIPRDRIGFRFNFFDNAQQVTGFGPPVFNPQTGVGTSFPQTRDYNVERYTFNFEKTFLNQWGSVELRIPFSTGLSSNLNLSAGDITGPVTAAGFPVTSTPERTLGSDGTQFDNMTLIFKGLLYRSSPLAVSAGVALGIPTGADTDVRIIDYSGMTGQGVATVQRERDIHIDNETWSLSPFLAAVYTPTKRFFTQGFLQFDFGLNNSTINYSNTFTQGTCATHRNHHEPDARGDPLSQSRSTVLGPQRHLRAAAHAGGLGCRLLAGARSIAHVDYGHLRLPWSCTTPRP